MICTNLDNALVSNDRAKDENDKGPGLSLGVAKSCGKVAVEITDMESPSPDPSPHMSKLIAAKRKKKRGKKNEL